MARRGIIRRRRYLRRRRRNRRLATRGAVYGVVNRMSETKMNTYTTFSTLAQPGTMYVKKIGDTISRGNDMGDRTGAKITMRRLIMAGHFRNPNTAAGNGAYIRLMLLQLRGDITDTTTGLFKSESDNNTAIDYNTGGNINQINMPFSRGNRYVLWQKRIYLPVQSTERNATRLFCYSIPICGKKITYMGSSVEPRPVMYLCWFYETETGAATFTSPCHHDLRVIEYFKDM